MKIQFNEPGLYKVGNRVVEVKSGQILEVASSDIERYRWGDHYQVVIETQTIVDTTSDPAPGAPAPAPGESDEDRAKREAAEAAEAAAKPKGGKGSGGK